jgi:Secretion system C-terminal sorting domain
MNKILNLSPAKSGFAGIYRLLQFWINFSKISGGIFLFFVFLLIPKHNQAQDKFNKIYDLDTNAIYNIIVNTINIDSNRYFFSGNSLDIVDYNKCHFFCGIMNDSGGIIQLKKNYIDSVSNFYNEHSCRFHSNFFTAFCAYNRQEATYDVYLYYIDNHLNTIWSKKIGVQKKVIGPVKLFLNQKNNLIIAGGLNNNIGARGFFLELDTFGNMIHLDTAILALTQSELFDIIPSKTDGGYLCAGTAYIGDVGQNYICKLDSTGHQIWSRTIGGAGEDGSLGIEYLNDTTFLVSGFRRLVVRGTAYGNLIVITEHNQLKLDILPLSPDINIQEIDKLTKKGDFIYGYGYSHTSDSVIIFCMDTAYHFVWARYYLRDRGSNLLYDFRSTDDGGFIASGFVLGPYNQDGWVLKLDSLGCDVVNCWLPDTTHHIDTTHIDSTIDSTTTNLPLLAAGLQCRLYPNPVRDKLIVELIGNIEDNDYSITISDVLGKVYTITLLPNKITAIDLSSLPAALYFYEIKNKNNLRLQSGKVMKE